jgi:hypothetical protein
MKKKIAIIALLFASAHAMNEDDSPSSRSTRPHQDDAYQIDTSSTMPGQAGFLQSIIASTDPSSRITGPHQDDVHQIDTSSTMPGQARFSQPSIVSNDPFYRSTRLNQDDAYQIDTSSTMPGQAGFLQSSIVSNDPFYRITGPHQGNVHQIDTSSTLAGQGQSLVDTNQTISGRTMAVASSNSQQEESKTGPVNVAVASSNSQQEESKTGPIDQNPTPSLSNYPTAQAVIEFLRKIMGPWNLPQSLVILANDDISRAEAKKALSNLVDPKIFAKSNRIKTLIDSNNDLKYFYEDFNPLLTQVVKIKSHHRMLTALMSMLFTINNPDDVKPAMRDGKPHMIFFSNLARGFLPLPKDWDDFVDNLETTLAKYLFTKKTRPTSPDLHRLAFAIHKQLGSMTQQLELKVPSNYSENSQYWTMRYLINRCTARLESDERFGRAEKRSFPDLKQKIQNSAQRFAQQNGVDLPSAKQVTNQELFQWQKDIQEKKPDFIRDLANFIHNDLTHRN